MKTPKCRQLEKTWVACVLLSHRDSDIPGLPELQRQAAVWLCEVAHRSTHRGAQRLALEALSDWLDMDLVQSANRDACVGLIRPSPLAASRSASRASAS